MRKKNAKRWKPLTRLLRKKRSRNENKNWRGKKSSRKNQHTERESQKLNGKEITWSNSYWWTLALTHSHRHSRRIEAQRRRKRENRNVVALKLRNFWCACNWTINAVCCMSRQNFILIPQLNPVPSRQWKQDEIVDKHKMRIRKISKKEKKTNRMEQNKRWERWRDQFPRTHTHVRRAMARDLSNKIFTVQGWIRVNHLTLIFLTYVLRFIKLYKLSDANNGKTMNRRDLALSFGRSLSINKVGFL